MLNANPLAYKKGAPPFGLSHYSPKHQRKLLRKELEGEALDYERRIAKELEGLEDTLEAKVRATKIAAAEAYQNIVGNIRDRIRRLKGIGARV